MFIPYLFSGSTQVCHFSPDAFKSELPVLFQSHPFTSNQTTVTAPSTMSSTWLTCVWNYLSEHFTWSLSDFSGLYLIPVGTSQLAKISQTDVVILKTQSDFRSNNSLSTDDQNLMDGLGTTMLHSVPLYALKHPALKECMCEPTSEGMIHAIKKLESQKGR